MQLPPRTGSIAQAFKGSYQAIRRINHGLYRLQSVRGALYIYPSLCYPSIVVASTVGVAA
jgi:hypothetical protein